MKIGDFLVPGFISGSAGFNGRVTAVVDAPTDDLSGHSSSTDRADRGVKPKQLRVSFSLRYSERDYLTELAELAEARLNDVAVKYAVIGLLPSVLRIRQAQFAGELAIDQDEVMRCWHVRFRLIEHRSVPEAAAARAAKRAGGTPESAVQGFEALVSKMEAA